MEHLDFTNLEIHTAAYITNLYESPALPHYPYHNLTHTRGVVDHAKEMAKHYQLSAADSFVVSAAGWFHDIGHLYGPMAGHEERGVVFMREHLTGVSVELQATISDCIMATKFPSHPTSLLQSILCDADTYHLGTTLFIQTDPLVRQEVELRTGRVIPNWRQRTLDFLRQHHFFTDYCQRLLSSRKKENMDWVEAQIMR